MGKSYAIDEAQKEKNEELLNREEIPNTPFGLVKLENKYFLTVGKFRVSEMFQTKEEAIKDAKTINWNRISTLIIAMIDANNQHQINIKDLEA